MLYRVIDASELPSLVSAFMETYEVVAPVKRDRSYVFEAVESFDDIELGYDTTVSSPKKYFLPPTETLFPFDARDNEVAAFAAEITPRVIFGAHACDINALNRLDLVFRDGRYPDPYYVARRKATLIVGVSCTPDDTCFCNLWGADEARFGYDLFLQDLGGKYLVSISSVEAANILEAACNPRVATDEDRIEFRHATRRRQDAFNGEIPDIQDVAMLMDAFHKDPYWEELGGRCLACTACSAVCPTCFCFDIQDTLDPDGKTGRRERTWDSCTSPQFAQVAGGHNFRADGRNRVRHRMYHKLNGFLANHDRMLCVGCGRCVTACKANINPIEVLRFFERKGADDAE
ncbi:4Fe-4S dicluster domain-containing protein [Gordonibacter massiliensis (ex Traore et al. 2017)]|uniref:4Fe-4S dicluster domain-containing protein n=1 Tax=Gordonibacter massiliensis (ex Traore et al. 2017) TaxID=1841863 RepID=A0A842JM11_9ACTN|nr:4Fe-4S dicluster domain-containing protein [Gordonibacter massiliensis (ex Traore et al. 2017)]MBC2890745.1 4Fe-4S dicluster domain-containing protein [Gordonibacter massiliensis (ex Traore et al. 2017)]MBX9034053.1 4Fe-4S ferredoxin [Gordonibacter massiliensis (ex Traore et al. 2017)]